MTIASKPERADVCIIGAGATGATAAKVLTEAGRHVVALEKDRGAPGRPSVATSWPTSTATTCGRTRS